MKGWGERGWTRRAMLLSTRANAPTAKTKQKTKEKILLARVRVLVLGMMDWMTFSSFTVGWGIAPPDPNLTAGSVPFPFIPPTTTS